MALYQRRSWIWDPPCGHLRSKVPLPLQLTWPWSDGMMPQKISKDGHLDENMIINHGILGYIGVLCFQIKWCQRSIDWKCSGRDWRWTRYSTCPRKTKSGWKCFGGVWRWTSQSIPPTRRSRKCFSGVWRWTSHSIPPTRRSQTGSASAGFEGGQAIPNPPGKKKPGWKCFGGVWRWTKPFQTPTKKKSGWKCFGGVWRWSKPREEEIWLEVLRQGLKVDKTSSRISSSRGFGLACPPSNPAKALPAQFLLPGRLDPGKLMLCERRKAPKH